MSLALVSAPADLYSEWLISPAALAGAAAGIVLFMRGFVRLRRRGRSDRASVSQLGFFLAAVGVVIAALMSPLDPIGDRYLLSAHMLQHLLLFDAAPVLMLLALRRPLLFFVVPPSLLRAVAHGSPRRAAGVLGRPETALAASLLASVCWQLPPVYDYALSHPAAHVLEHVTLLAAGFLVWQQLLDPEAGTHGAGRSSAVWCGAFCLGGLVLGAVLLLSPAELYGAYADEPQRLFGLDPRLDQQLAGLIMLCTQLVMLSIALHLSRHPRAARQSELLTAPATAPNTS